MTTGRWIEMENGKRKELDFEYKVQDDKECMKVWMQIDGCKETGNLDITFYSEVNDGMFPVMEVTEEFGVPMEKNRMFIKESMTLDFALAFLQKYGIGTPTGETGRCGIRECPVFEFNEEVLRELDPEGYRQYEEIHEQVKREPIQEMPDTVKTAQYQWEYGEEKIALYVESYMYGGGICVQMYHREEESWELFGDLTVNLPGYMLEPEEAFISADYGRDKLEFIKDYGMGKILPVKGHSGMQQYSMVEFNLEKLAEFDEVGVRKYCRNQGIELNIGKNPSLQETKGSMGKRQR